MINMCKMINNEKIAMVLMLCVSYSQFKSTYVKKPAEDLFFDVDEENNKEEEPRRLAHKQILSAGFSLRQGLPLSVFSYTNAFTYDLRKDIVADIKIHGRFMTGAYKDIWGGQPYTTPHLAMDAGIRYSPMDNGVFDLHARTFHDQWWSGQSIYLTFLGIPIKRLYNSKSFDSYFGPNPLK